MALCASLVPAVAGAQVYLTDAGTSSLFDATGGTFEVRGRRSAIQVSAGQLQDGFAIGGLLRHTRGRVIASLGDGVLDFDLPSDVFGGSHNLPLRGLRLERRSDTTRVLGFAGVGSTTVGAPFFRGGRTGEPLGVVFVDRTLRPGWRLLSRNAFSTRQTSIQALEWRPRPLLALTVSGGVGNDRPYVATSVVTELRWLSAKAVFASHPAGFRRVHVDSPTASEVERENVAVSLRPSSRWSVGGSRMNLFQEDGLTATRVTVNQLDASATTLGVRLAGSLFDSRGAHRSSLGTSVSAGRAVTKALDVSVDYSRYAPRDDNAPSSSGGVTVRDAVHPRLSLLGVARITGDSPSFHVGGEFLSNPLTASVSYQTIYAPLRTGNPFVQTVGVDVRVNGPRGLEIRAGTYATPDGRLKYTVSGRKMVFADASGAASGMRMPKRVIRGLVADAGSRPLEGAVLGIGSETVVTGEDGRFSLRTDAAAPLVVRVLLDEFVAPGHFEVVEAPATVLPSLDAGATEYRVVLRRLGPPAEVRDRAGRDAPRAALKSAVPPTAPFHTRVTRRVLAGWRRLVRDRDYH